MWGQILLLLHACDVCVVRGIGVWFPTVSTALQGDPLSTMTRGRSVLPVFRWFSVSCSNAGVLSVCLRDKVSSGSYSVFSHLSGNSNLANGFYVAFPHGLDYSLRHTSIPYSHQSPVF